MVSRLVQVRTWICLLTRPHHKANPDHLMTPRTQRALYMPESWGHNLVIPGGRVYRSANKSGTLNCKVVRIHGCSPNYTPTPLLLVDTEPLVNYGIPVMRLSVSVRLAVVYYYISVLAASPFRPSEVASACC